MEFKQSATDNSVILRAICALSNDLPNRGGGDLLIGVDKYGNAVDGTDVSDRALLAFTDMRDNGKIIDRPSVVVDRAKFQGKDVVHIRVTASSTPPVRLDGIAWVRPGPTTRRATRDAERVLSERRRSNEGPFDTRTVHGTTLDDLDLTPRRAQAHVRLAFRRRCDRQHAVICSKVLPGLQETGRRSRETTRQAGGDRAHRPPVTSDRPPAAVGAP
ncbi:ATP-binding protein [Actinosynnema sp. NPDC023794]